EGVRASVARACRARSHLVKKFMRCAFRATQGPSFAFVCSSEALGFGEKRGHSAMNRSKLHPLIAAVGAAALTTAGTVGCTSSGTVYTTGYVYDDAYLYTSYYPADVAYASYYYAYPWNYNTFYYYLNAYGPGTGNTGTSSDAGTSGNGGTSGTASDAGTST